MSKNKIGYEKQAKMVAENIPQPFVFEYEGENIEVNPMVTCFIPNFVLVCYGF